MERFGAISALRAAVIAVELSAAPQDQLSASSDAADLAYRTALVGVDPSVVGCVAPRRLARRVDGNERVRASGRQQEQNCLGRICKSTVRSRAALIVLADSRLISLLRTTAT